MPKATPTEIDACLAEIHGLDLDRADQLEAIATKYNCLPQVQTEINALRQADRREQRRQQLNQSLKLVTVAVAD